jgi:hypothetical protein
LCTAASVLFGLNVGDGAPEVRGFYELNVDASGVSVINMPIPLVGNDFSLGVDALHERIFSTSGQVLDVAEQMVVQTLPVMGLVKADSVLGRVFYLVQNPPPSNTTWTIHAFNIDGFAETGTAMDIPGVNGNPSSLIRWGTNGLAFRTDSNQVFLITSSLVGP